MIVRQQRREDAAGEDEERGGEAAGNYENVADFDGAGRMVQQAIDEFGRR